MNKKFTKEISFSCHIKVAKDLLGETKYGFENVDQLITDLLDGSFEPTFSDKFIKSPLSVDSVLIGEIDEEWIEVN
jgi:hypothetical protein